MRVLIAFSSKYGATREIAESIGTVLEESGVKMDVLPAGDVGDVHAYGAVILGSAVYVGQWRQEAADFLKSHEQALSAIPVWLFSSGPTGEGNPKELMNGFTFPEALMPVAKRIAPKDIALFHGELNRSKLSIGERALVRMIKAPMGDFRDWDAIAAWAAGIAAALKSQGA